MDQANNVVIQVDRRPVLTLSAVKSLQQQTVLPAKIKYLIVKSIRDV